MATCKSKKYVGRDVVLEYVIGCGDQRPGAQEWLRFGSMRTKDFDLEWETADATDDVSVHNLRESLATFLSLSIAGDGTLVNAGDAKTNLVNLTKHFINPTATGGQPTVWMRMTFPDLTFTAFMLLSTLNRSSPYDDVATYSMEASSTSSDFGLLVEDTPDGDTPVIPDVESVTLDESEITLSQYATQTLVATVLPAGAVQTVTWTTSDAAVATVTQGGEVEAVADTGSATITATSTEDNNKSASCTVNATA